MTPEELIAMADKDDSCALSKKELMDFIEKWANKKHVQVSEETKRFENRAFDYMDDDKDGTAGPSEVLVSMRTAKKHSYVGEAAETLFGYF